MPTRLMDWTYSPLAALHFATSREDITGMNQHDAVVWAIDITEMNTLLPAKYQKVLNDERAYLFTIDMLDRVAKDLTTYDNDMGEDGIVLLEPPSIDQRIINQYSYFSIIPSRVEDIEQFLDEKTTRTVKYILDKEIRWQIRDMLDQCNVNERTIYPGLDGLASWIKRHYLLMCDKEAIEVQKILPFLSDTWPLCRIGRAVIRASQSCRQSCNKSQCPACGCRSHHSCTHAPQFSRSFPAREWGSVLQRQGACGQCP